MYSGTVDGCLFMATATPLCNQDLALQKPTSIWDADTWCVTCGWGFNEPVNCEPLETLKIRPARLLVVGG